MKIIISGLLAGFMSSALGVGLGLILSPILLSFGVDPVSTASTEINKAFYATLTSTIIVIIFGGMNF